MELFRVETLARRCVGTTRPIQAITRIEVVEPEGRGGMKISLLPSAACPTASIPRDAGTWEGVVSRQYLTSFLINDTIAVDAGSLGFQPLEVQDRVRHVLISHIHMDHVASLPIFLENVYRGASQAEAVAVHAEEWTWRNLRDDLFNDRVWPDFVRLSTPQNAFMRLAHLETDRPFELDGVRIRPVRVDHVVPTVGFVVEDDCDAVVIVSDTGPTEAIYEVARATPNLRAVFLEACFPNAMEGLAKVSKHLTPQMFGVEAAKLPPGVPVLAVHIKSRFQTQVLKELAALERPEIQPARMGWTYTW